jgi:hypothetical protein
MVAGAPPRPSATAARGTRSAGAVAWVSVSTKRRVARPRGCRCRSRDASGEAVINPSLRISMEACSTFLLPVISFYFGVAMRI